jgi:hypothetical protein
MPVDTITGKIKIRNQFGHERVTVESAETQFNIQNLFMNFADHSVRIEVEGSEKTGVQKLTITRVDDPAV